MCTQCYAIRANVTPTPKCSIGGTKERQSVARPIVRLGVRRGWVVSATPRPALLPGKRPGTHCAEGWVGPRACLGHMLRRKKLLHLPVFFNSTHFINILFVDLHGDKNKNLKDKFPEKKTVSTAENRRFKHYFKS